MNVRLSFLPLGLALLAAPLTAQAGDRARKLFVTNCATCHGETGDGKGTTQLDRPARSFMDGGFSFGNTPEALFRTISVGIPGTPMPAFDSSLSEDDRKLVASYVVTLGPPVEEVKEEDMILAVHDKPLVVRGHLPPIAEGLPHHPRGLLIGDPSGLTFEYTVDDVRLLALRQGGFVKRTDWTGRGGTPLEPLGKVVHLVEGGKPGALFSLGAGAFPLQAHLAGTLVEDTAVLAYHLTAPSGEVAHVEETPEIVSTRSGTGFRRHFAIVGLANHVHLALKDPTQVPKGRAWVTTTEGERFIALSADGSGGVQGLAVQAAKWSRKNGMLIIALEPHEVASLELTCLPVSTMKDAMKTLISYGKLAGEWGQ